MVIVCVCVCVCVSANHKNTHDLTDEDTYLLKYTCLSPGSLALKTSLSSPHFRLLFSIPPGAANSFPPETGACAVLEGFWQGNNLLCSRQAGHQHECSTSKFMKENEGDFLNWVVLLTATISCTVCTRTHIHTYTHTHPNAAAWCNILSRLNIAGRISMYWFFH